MGPGYPLTVARSRSGGASDSRQLTSGLTNHVFEAGPRLEQCGLDVFQALLRLCLYSVRDGPYLS